VRENQKITPAIEKERAMLPGPQGKPQFKNAVIPNVWNMAGGAIRRVRPGALPKPKPWPDPGPARSSKPSKNGHRPFSNLTQPSDRFMLYHL